MLLISAFSQPSGILRVLADKQTLSALWHSLYTASLATLIALALGSLFAYVT